MKSHLPVSRKNHQKKFPPIWLLCVNKARHFFFRKGPTLIFVVISSSGDPYFDDNAVRAVMMVSPLPPPPRAGVTVFVFRSEDD